MFKSTKSKLIIVLALVICLIAILIPAYARYQTTVSGNTDGVIAVYKVGTEKISISTNRLNPGGSTDYTFKVTNYEEKDGNKEYAQTALDYSIEIVATNNLPLTYKLTSVDDNTALTKQSDTLFSGGHFNSTEKGEGHTYTLKITFENSDEDNDELMHQLDDIDIVVRTKQSDD